MHSPRVLFILKQRPKGPYGAWNYQYGDCPLPSGLSVSAHQMAIALGQIGIHHKLIHVKDNNEIDKQVTAYKPTHVIIEAFWVVPDKFEVLMRLHPNVQWIVRNHSKTDFLSAEGGMIGWAIDYIKRGVILACNSIDATNDFKRLAVSVGAAPHTVTYLPNYYDAPKPHVPESKIVFAKMMRKLGLFKHHIKLHGELDIGCFGAIRPLKNHALQALAAIETAQILGVKLRFWVNGTRVEGKAEPILNSLRALFARYPQHELIELPWQEHAAFLNTVKSMTIVMQVSNSETFNIVAADAVSAGVPVLVSHEIPWIDREYKVSSRSSERMVQGLLHLLAFGGNGMLQADQLDDLYSYGAETKEIWGQYLRHGQHHKFCDDGQE